MPDRPDIALKVLERLQPEEFSDKSKDDSRGTINNVLIMLNNLDELKERVALLPLDEQQLILESAHNAELVDESIEE